MKAHVHSFGNPGIYFALIKNELPELNLNVTNNHATRNPGSCSLSTNWNEMGGGRGSTWTCPIGKLSSVFGFKTSVPQLGDCLTSGQWH